MPNRPTLLLLACGAFAVGTDGYVLSGILPLIASDIGVSDSVAGQLVTAFALTYAISAPVLMTVTANVSRRVMLYLSLTLFLLANVACAVASDYAVLMAARVLAGVGAAVYMNTAVATASALVGEEFRGRAVALVISGLTVATALGVPIGTMVGGLGSWRLTFGLVAALSVLVIVGLVAFLTDIPTPPAITMASRLRVAAEPSVLVAVVANLFAVAGCFVVFTYLAVLTSEVTPLSGAAVGAVLFAWGVAGGVGNVWGGKAADRRGGDYAFRAGVIGVTGSFAVLGLVAVTLPFGAAPTTVAFLLIAMVWSGLYWMIPPSQLQRVMERAPEAPAIALSVSSSSSYLGVALGGAAGGIVLSSFSATALPWAGAVLEACALAIVLTAARRTRRPAGEASRPTDVRTG
ncbi:MFS transporter [Streptomyces sp. N2-109]|uniref:MFS transporter n=1 Tax=Streptomyces gossypii TaxID=2883101 RepID=A0ABT2K1G4_9ACTN|nr:MFS transporter [Streptomyces gossypii]MCT2594015.1 MFS transporter [Streptomyces gossypii]